MGFTQRVWVRRAEQQSACSSNGGDGAHAGSAESPPVASRSGLHEPLSPAGPAAAENKAAQQTSCSSDNHTTQTWNFKLCTYNILADTYAQQYCQYLYKDVPQAYLPWEYRLPLIIKELTFWDPDVICLQEVTHFEALEQELQPAGYRGLFLRRAGRRCDGCAIFWKPSRFALEERQDVDFSRMGLEDSVALIVRLRPLHAPPGEHGLAPGPPLGEGVQGSRQAESSSISCSPLARPPSEGVQGTQGAESSASSPLGIAGSQPGTIGSGPPGAGSSPPGAIGISPPVAISCCSLVVATTHICFDPNKGDVKLGQIRELMSRVHQQLRRSPGSVAVVAGDFNMVPCCPLYEFIARGRLDLADHTKKKMSGQVKGYGHRQWFQAKDSRPPAAQQQLKRNQEQAHQRRQQQQQQQQQEQQQQQQQNQEQQQQQQQQQERQQQQQQNQQQQQQQQEQQQQQQPGCHPRLQLWSHRLTYEAMLAACPSVKERLVGNGTAGQAGHGAKAGPQGKNGAAAAADRQAGSEEKGACAGPESQTPNATGRQAGFEDKGACARPESQAAAASGRPAGSEDKGAWAGPESWVAAGDSVTLVASGTGDKQLQVQGSVDSGATATCAMVGAAEPTAPATPTTYHSAPRSQALQGTRAGDSVVGASNGSNRGSNQTAQGSNQGSSQGSNQDGNQTDSSLGPQGTCVADSVDSTIGQHGGNGGSGAQGTADVDATSGCLDCPQGFAQGMPGAGPLCDAREPPCLRSASGSAFLAASQQCLPASQQLLSAVVSEQERRSPPRRLVSRSSRAWSIKALQAALGPEAAEQVAQQQQPMRRTSTTGRAVAAVQAVSTAAVPEEAGDPDPAMELSGTGGETDKVPRPQEGSSGGGATLPQGPGGFVPVPAVAGGVPTLADGSGSSVTGPISVGGTATGADKVSSTESASGGTQASQLGSPPAATGGLPSAATGGSPPAATGTGAVSKRMRRMSSARGRGDSFRDFVTGTAPLVAVHPLRLASSYSYVQGEEPMFTSVHSEFIGTCDYIWFSPEAPVACSSRQEAASHSPEAPIACSGRQEAASHRSNDCGTRGAPAVNPGAPGDSQTGNPSAPGHCRAGNPGAPGHCRAGNPGMPGSSQAGNPGSPQAGNPGVPGSSAAGNPPRNVHFRPGVSQAKEQASVTQLVPLAVLAPPHIDCLRNGLPSQGWGSDHVSLLCEFALECPCERACP